MFEKIFVDDKCIRVFGNVFEIRFCGRDICEILGIRDFKDAIQKMVPSDQKTELKNFLGELKNGWFGPSELGGNNPPQPNN